MNNYVFRIELLSTETPNELEEFAAALELLGEVTVHAKTRTLFLNPETEDRDVAIKQLNILAKKGYCTWTEIAS